MKGKSANRLLARLSSLRSLQEELARGHLARGHQREAAATAALVVQETRQHRMEALVSTIVIRHIHDVKDLKCPAARVSTLSAAMVEDRRQLSEMVQQTEMIRRDYEQSVAEVAALRIAFLRATRQREATETLGRNANRADQRRLDLTSEDTAADVARATPRSARP